MAQHVNCPNCFATLKPSTLPPLGAKVRCPKCEQSFRLAVEHIHASQSEPRVEPSPHPLASRPVTPVRTPQSNYASPVSAGVSADHASNVPAWAWAAGGGLVSAIVLVVVLLACGAFDRAPQRPGETMPNRTVAQAGSQTPVQQQPAPSVDNSAISPFQSMLAPDAATRTDGAAPTSESHRVADPPADPSAYGGLPSSPSKRVAANEAIQFALKPDLSYFYDFEITSGEQGQGPVKLNGSVNYKLEPARAQQPGLMPQVVPTKKQGSGTAFVINSSGWLVTCAHVVEDAAKIEVVIGNRTLPAKAVEVDNQHDIALLKVEADDLRALPVAGAAPAQGDDANVAGFPLTTMLGDSLKITHGRIAGFVDRKGEHFIQIDASVNPGNSGGPLLNAEGEVIGVVNAGLFGSDISAVGLSIDLAPLRELVARHSVDWKSGSGGSPLAGSTLAEQVRGSIARVRVEIEPAKAKDQIRVRYSGTVTSSSTKTNSFARPAGGVVIVSPQGEVLDVERQTDYSLLATSTSGLAFDLLPRAGQHQWSTSRQSEVVQRETENNDDSGFPFPGPRFGGPPGFPRFGPAIPNPRLRFGPGSGQAEQNGKRLSVEEQLSYELAELTDDKAVVDTSYTSVRTEEPSGKLWGKVVGAGQYTFDRKQGVITTGYMELKLRAQQEGAEISVPFQIAYKMREALTGQQIAVRAEKARKEADERAAQRQTQQRDKLAAAIAALKGANEYTANDVLRRALSDLDGLGHEVGKSPERDEVGPLLNPYLKNPDDGIRRSAINAAANWATKENIPALLELVSSSDHFQQRAAIEGLGTSGGDLRSATVLGKMMDTSDFGLRWQLRDALKKMKNVAEPAVLPLLNSTNEDVVDDACQVLGETGGRKSFDALSALLIKSDQGRKRSAIQDALDKVKKRLAATQAGSKDDAPDE